MKPKNESASAPSSMLVLLVWTMRSGGGVGESGGVLDNATAEDGEVQGAPVEAGRQVERLEIDEERHERRDEDAKDPAQLEAVEQNNGLWQKTTSKTSWKDTQ